LNAPALTNLRAQQTAALERIAELSAELGPIHPSVKNAEARVNELRRLIDAELERIRASTNKDFEQARNVEERLRRDVEQLRQRALVAAQASVKLRDLEREVEVNRGVYQSFFARSRQTEEAQPSNLMSTHIVTTAAAPASRNFPPSAGLMMAAGAVLGALLGAALSVALEMRKGVPREERNFVGSNDAAWQPTRFAITDATQFAIRPNFGPRSRIELSRLGIPVAIGPEDRIEIDAIASHFQSLIDASNEPKIIALVGETSDDARTIMSINLALALSSAGLDIALVDADPKKAVLDSFFDPSAGGADGARDFVVQTREEVILALPSYGEETSKGASRNRIMRGLLRGDMGRIDAIICDGAFDDPNAFEQIDWVVLVLDAGADENAVLARLPEALVQRTSLIVRFEHENPWAGQDAKLSKTA
jgi:Mrp family chromosome partitioning ATPase